MNLFGLFKKKAAPIRTYADFWNWFRLHAPRFHKVVKERGAVEEEFFDQLSPRLAELKEGFFFLTGMYNADTVELILTADGAVPNIVFVEELVAAAPQLPGWRITALKAENCADDTNIKMDGYLFNKDNIWFYANEHPEYPDEIDITFIHDDYHNNDEVSIKNGVYIFLDNLLGELKFVTTIDVIRFETRNNAGRDLIPVEKLKDFLRWREKEFTEKYEHVKYDHANDNYAMLQAELKTGGLLIAVVNTGVLEWEGRPTHPWIACLQMKYDAKANGGMPDKPSLAVMEQVEDELVKELEATGSYLHAGRETADGTRVLYFVGKDFREISKVMQAAKVRHTGRVPITYDIYKDKYWQTFNRFQQL